MQLLPGSNNCQLSGGENLGGLPEGLFRHLKRGIWHSIVGIRGSLSYPLSLIPNEVQVYCLDILVGSGVTGAGVLEPLSRWEAGKC